MNLLNAVLILELIDFCLASGKRGKTGVIRRGKDHDKGEKRSGTKKQRSAYTNVQRKPTASLWQSKSNVMSDLAYDVAVHPTTIDPPNHFGGMYNGRKLASNSRSQIVEVIPGTGEWIRFAFGGSDVIIDHRFAVVSVNNKKMIVVKLIDFYCTGDTFKVFAMEGNQQRKLGETTNSRPDGCQTTTVDPETAWLQGFWSKGEFVLLPGRHMIVIAAVSSPYGGGTAAIKFDEEDILPKALLKAPAHYPSLSGSGSSGASTWSEGSSLSSSSSSYDDRRRSRNNKGSTRSNRRRTDNKRSKNKKSERRKNGESRSKRKSSSKLNKDNICLGVNGLIVVREAVTGRGIESACRGYDRNWRPAAVDDSKRCRGALKKTLNQCVEPTSTVWIGSYNNINDGQYYGTTLLSNGNVESAPWTGSASLPVLCFTKQD